MTEDYDVDATMRDMYKTIEELKKENKMKSTSNSILWDTDWEAIQVSQHDHSKLFLFCVRKNKQWYYGEGETIQLARIECEVKIEMGVKAKKANVKAKLEELF